MGEPMVHDAIEAVFPDLYAVRGAFRPGPGVMFSRTMIILRHAGELALVNPIRLTPAGEEALAALGEVRHLVRIGAFHGADDPWLVQRYKPLVWGFPNGRHPAGVVVDRPLVDAREPGAEAGFPFPGVAVYRFRNAKIPEAALLAPAGGGTLLTCDAIQNSTDDKHTSALGRFALRTMGFLGHAKVGPPWRMQMQQRGGPSLAEDYRALLALPFDNLIGGHGAPLIGGAKAHLAAEVERLWGPALPSDGAAR